ncbi:MULTISPECIES: T6SS phospholipase effector Tle1-like catalytic domain-containing protein [Streptomyces]|uniref:T6SS phospholipase effector Tle1-like catalytic domain-containing protein n=1 Tax=Streptomyces TaxID=1883 RepID=UPI000A9753C7|nr:MULTISPECIES: DUF2235 domain-containing protein [Streptomyces]
MGKNIVVCLDGTGNQLKARGNTNVVKLYEMLDLHDPTAQIAYYDPGVGTFSAAGAWTTPGRKISKLLGLAFGSGLKANLAEAYTYLMHHYEPGDRIFLFGFSRGAYTARALAGLLKSVGLLRRGGSRPETLHTGKRRQREESAPGVGVSPVPERGYGISPCRSPSSLVSAARLSYAITLRARYSA